MNNFRSIQYPIFEGPRRFDQNVTPEETVNYRTITVTDREIRDVLNTILKSVDIHYKERGTLPHFILLNEKTYGAFKARIQQDPDFRFSSQPPQDGILKFDRFTILCDPSQNEEAITLAHPEKEFGTSGPKRYNPLVHELAKAKQDIFKLKDQLDSATRESMYASDAHAEAIADLETSNRKLEHLNKRVTTMKRAILPLYVLVGACVAVTIVNLFF